MFNFFEPGGENPGGKRGGLARERVMFLRGGRVDTRMYTMVLKKLIGFFQKIVHTKAVRLLRIIFWRWCFARNTQAN